MILTSIRVDKISQIGIAVNFTDGTDKISQIGLSLSCQPDI